MKYLQFISILFLFSFLASCSTEVKSPEKLAEKFCKCSEEMGKALVKEKEKLIDKVEFEKIRIEQIKCMGSKDPREEMSPEEVEKFDKVFFETMKKKCPNVARNYGFKD